MISFNDLLKKVFTLYSNNFKTIVPLLFLTLVWNIVLAVTSVSVEASIRLLIPVLAVSFLISSYTQLTLTAAFGAALGNQPVSLGALFLESLKKFPVFLLLVIVLSLILLVGILFMIFPAIIFATWFMFVPAVYMLEEGRAIGAFARSRRLVAGHFFGLLFKTGAVMLAALFVSAAARQGLLTTLQIVSTPAIAPHLQTIADVFGAILSSFLLPVIVGTVVVLYYDMKRLRS